jgi:formylglycine-generating enzyme required for sulfatase activity
VEEDLGLDGAEVPPTLRVDVADALPDAVEPGPSPAPALRSSGGSSRRWGRAAVVAAASVAIAAAIVAVGPQVARWLETARSRAFAERPGAAERTGVEPVEPAGRAPLRAPAVPGEGQPSERAASRAPSTGGERAASPDREQTAARRPPAPPAPAKLTVRSNVSGDRFSVDGRVIGPTGSSVHEIEPGRHVVRVEKEGRIPWEETVEVTSGERRILLARLEEVEPVVADAPRPAADWIRVPGGEFFSGCNVQVDTECEAVEKPGRTRPVAAFSIDRTEVTVEAFALCVAAGACSEEGLTMPFWSGRPQAEWAFACNWGKEGWEQHPINCVDWYQARAFCTWRGARLPGEWEWEKAARGTDGRRYAWGSEGVETAGRVANLADLAAGRVRSDWAVTEDYDDGHYTTSPVGAFAAGASPYGALDMIGNVWEWTATPFESDPNRRVLRGGSWVDVPRYARASARIWADPHARNEDVGFRCAQ